MDWTVMVVIAAAGAAFGCGYGLRLLLSRKGLTSAERRSQQLLEEAGRQAEATRKQAALEAKEQRIEEICVSASGKKKGGVARSRPRRPAGSS